MTGRGRSGETTGGRRAGLRSIVPALIVAAAVMPQRLLVGWVHGYNLVGPA